MASDETANAAAAPPRTAGELGRHPGVYDLACLRVHATRSDERVAVADADTLQAWSLVMSARTLLLGDWNRVIRDPIDLLRLLFLVAAVIFLVHGDLGGAARTFVTFGLLVLARWVALPRPFDLALVVAMALQTLGYPLDFFATFSFWDETLHSFVPAVVAPLLYITLVRLDALPDLGGLGRGEQRHRYVGILLATVALGVALGAFYEVWEYAGNHYLGTSYRIGYADAVADMTLNTIGSLVGGLMLLVWAEFGWGTVRRMPGQKARQASA